MRRSICLMLLLPALAGAQALEFELQPEAFPVDISGWQPFSPWAGGLDETTPEFCDIDSDGDLDCFLGAELTYFWFYENIGSALMPQFQYVSSSVDSLYCLGGQGSFYHGNLRFCDLDSDGDFDALTSVQILGLSWNVGTAVQRNFALPLDTILDTNGEAIGCSHLELADIDGDGDVDLFTEDWSPSALRLWENIGTPQQYVFQLASSNWQNLQVSAGSPDPCFGDLDTDGDLDLLVGTGAGTVYYYRNDGDSATAQMTYLTNNYCSIDVEEDASPELADIDGDGDLDLFVGRAPNMDWSTVQGDVFFYENIGTPQEANFQFVTSNYLTWDCGYSATPRLVDIDGDSLPDLLSHIDSRLLYYRNEGGPGNPVFVYQSDSFAGIDLFDLMPWFCDIDGDGDLDLLAGTSAIPGPPGLHLYLNQGTPQIPNFVLYSDDLVPEVFTQNSVILMPGTVDIDADGDQDLFVSDVMNNFYYFENVGTPTNFQFQFITNNWQNLWDNNYLGTRKFCFYDIDRDGDQDLFYEGMRVEGSTIIHSLRFYRNAGTPQSAQMVLENDDLFPGLMIWQAAPFLIDMDQDGDGDMFVGDIWGGIRYFKNVTGDTTQVAPPPIYRHPQAGLQISLGPNPANPNTVISFSLPFAQQIDLAVYNLLGARVTTLASGLKLPGSYVIPWDASGNASGVYIIRLETPQENISEKLTIIK